MSTALAIRPAPEPPVSPAPHPAPRVLAQGAILREARFYASAQRPANPVLALGLVRQARALGALPEHLAAEAERIERRCRRRSPDSDRTINAALPAAEERSPS